MPRHKKTRRWWHEAIAVAWVTITILSIPLAVWRAIVDRNPVYLAFPAMLIACGSVLGATMPEGD